MYSSHNENDHHQLANPAVLAVVPYQPGKTISDIQNEFKIQEVVKLASNENPIGPSPLALKAMMAALSDIHLYPDDGGIELKEALAQKHAVKVNQVILGHGATDILEIIARTFLCPDDEVISAAPTFPWFQMLGQLSGARNVVVPLRGFRHDLHKMKQSITSKTKLIFIANPNNPTGTFLKWEEVKSFLDSIPKNVIVILDEAYIDYVTSEKIDDRTRQVPAQVIIVRTFSKISGLAGLRIGYAIAESEIIGLLEKARQPFNTTSLAHVAAMASLQDQDHIKQARQSAVLGKAFFYSEFERLKIDYVPTDTNFIFVDFHRQANLVVQQLQKLGFIIRPVSETCARITIGTEKQNKSLAQALGSVLSKIPIVAKTT